MAERRRGQVIAYGKDKWCVRIFRGRDANGKRIYHTKVIDGSKTVAQKYLTAKLREKDLGISIQTSRQTLDEHLDLWLETVKMRVSVQTYNSYESLLRVHVRKRLGWMRLPEIKIGEVQNIYSEMIQSGSSPSTVQHVHAVLAMAMKKAVEFDIIIRNPCDFVELPRQDREETKAFSPEQARTFLEHAKKTKQGIIFEFAMISGMRPEEYLSITWSDLDFIRSTATVRRALIWLRGGGYKFGEPKTRKSRRTISLPQDLMARLKSYRQRQLTHRIATGGVYTNIDLVFASEVGTPLNYRNITLRHYNKILKDSGLDNQGFVLYSLRHTCATLLLAAGENPKKVADRLGHSSIRTTLDTYSHVLPDMERSTAEKLESMLYA